MGGMAWAVYDVKIIGVRMHAYVTVITLVLYKSIVQSWHDRSTDSRSGL